MRKCFISYKKEDVTYKNYLVKNLGSESFINKSLDRRIDSNRAYRNCNYHDSPVYHESVQ